MSSKKSKKSNRCMVGIHLSSEQQHEPLTTSEKPLGSRQAAIAFIKGTLEKAVRIGLKSGSSVEKENSVGVLSQPVIDKIIGLFKDNDSISLVDTSDESFMSI